MIEEKNKWYYQLINRITSELVLLSSHVDKNAVYKPDPELKPLWVTGLFRSGTSVTTEILSKLGMDLGPAEHLLQAWGNRKDLNPNGFFENYLFMDLSLFLFHKTNSWGDRPPSPDDVRKLDLNTLDYREFVRYSLETVHDDRISNFNKLKVLRNYSPRTLNQYVWENFGSSFAVKNPHFSVLWPFLGKHWPQSSFLVTFRNPDASLASAKKISPKADYSLYTRYYSGLLNQKDFPVHYLSYDRLLSDPERSIRSLAETLSLDPKQVPAACQLIDPKLHRFRQEPDKAHWPEELKHIFDSMNQRALNSWT